MSKSRFDERRAKIICKHLAEGQTRECAAELADISPRTFRHWMTWGSNGEKPFNTFVAAVKRAERKAEAEAVKHIRRQGKKVWTAYCWWLERKLPESWSKDRDLIRELAKRVEQLEAKRG